MCYAFKQRSYWCIYDFLLDIMFFIFVPILCVHVYLWTYIFVIGVYLETYTHENSYIFNWYSNSLVTTPCSFLILWWFLIGTSFVLFVTSCFCCSTSYLLQVVLLLFLYALLRVFVFKISKREWGFHVVHTILKYKSLLCTYLGEFPLDY